MNGKQVITAAVLAGSLYGVGHEVHNAKDDLPGEAVYALKSGGSAAVHGVEGIGNHILGRHPQAVPHESTMQHIVGVLTGSDHLTPVLSVAESRDLVRTAEFGGLAVGAAFMFRREHTKQKIEREVQKRLGQYNQAYNINSAAQQQDYWSL